MSLLFVGRNLPVRQAGKTNRDVEDMLFDSLSHLDFINYDKLKAQYGSVELDQILAELRIEMAWTLSKIVELIDTNENLILTLESK